MNNETWRPIPGFPDHAISTIGRVKVRKRTIGGRTYRPRMLSITKQGTVYLTKEGHYEPCQLRRLYKEAFGVRFPGKINPMRGRYLN